MRCIFCKHNAGSSKSVEHILPESLGNIEHTLPPGVVCDSCNNYFAGSVEQPVLESGEFTAARFNMLIPNKRGRVPGLTGILLPGTTSGKAVAFHRAEVSRMLNGDLTMDPDEAGFRAIAADRVNRVIIPASGGPPDPQVFSRFLGKVAIEALADCLVKNAPHLLDEIIDHSQLDKLRNYARYGKTGLQWPYLKRRIYPADFSFGFGSGEGGSYEVLHEWDFLNTDTGEMYLVLAIFGMEYVINLGGPDVDGYSAWLQTHDDQSPLYVSPL
jgi:hypothetical protein